MIDRFNHLNYNFPANQRFEIYLKLLKITDSTCQIISEEDSGRSTLGNLVQMF